MSTLRIGEARDRHERDVEAACLRVPAWKGRDIRYGAVHGGISNQNWRIEIDGDPRTYFLKVPGEGTDMFIDRICAHQAAVNAHAVGIGPQVIHFDPADGVEVSEFLDGYRACTNGDLLDPDIQESVIDLYRRFHATPKLTMTKTAFDMIEQHVEQAVTFASLMPEDFAWLMQRYRQAKDALTASGLDIVPCFNDPMPGNFLVGENLPMKLIDYEYASNNDRFHEIGLLVGEGFMTEADTLRLIEAYFGAVTPQSVARVMVHKALADIKWAFWAIVNRKLKSWDFDYQKYGVWKFMRAREVLHDTRWDAWLRAV